MTVLGHYVSGMGLAHQHEEVYRHFFGCPMKATFNVKASIAITHFKPTMQPDHPDGGKSSVWLVKVNGHYAWAYRSPNTRQAGTTWELVSKDLLPDELKEGELELEVLDRWSDAEVQAWIAKSYVNKWHQTFDWSPSGYADSPKLWDAIEPHACWSESSVLDVGCGWGVHSIKASKLGARVTAVDPMIGNAIDVNDHIEMSDVSFRQGKDPGGDYDIILYLSVHHQPDPTYAKLEETLAGFRERASVVFVELIMPPMFGTPALVEAATKDADELLRYKHNIRGTRALYRFGRKS